MGSPRPAPPAKLICAVMHRPEADPQAVLTSLAGAYGRVESRTACWLFDGSDYYGPEMGPGLEKFVVSFEPMVDQERLPGIKRVTNTLEMETAAANGGRVFNLDPGLVTLHNVVLATTKGYAHRVYVADGIWEEVTLLWNAGRFEPLPWTYPDYRREDVRSFLGGVRERLKDSLAERRRSSVGMRPGGEE